MYACLVLAGALLLIGAARTWAANEPDEENYVGASGAIEYRSAECTAALPPGAESVSLKVAISADGSHRIWSRLSKADKAGGSVFMQVDGGCPVLIQPNPVSKVGEWQWIDFQNGRRTTKIDMFMVAGEHTVTITPWRGRLNIDAVLFSATPDCIPIGASGHNCLAP
jgi:hypothetical protein